MRNCGQVAATHFAPAAEKCTAELQKINRPLVFIFPFEIHNFPLMLVNLNDRTGTDYRIHAIIAHADESVRAVAQIQMLYQPDRHFAPYIHYSRQLREARIGQVYELRFAERCGTALPRD